MISVVIPLYNKGEFIENAIRSVLRQSIQACEVIVVDDGSTDEGGSIAQKFVSSGVTLIRQVNLGVSAARNIGVLYSSSPYIAFLDADDEWLPSHLETLQALAIKYPSAVLLSTSHVERSGGRSRQQRSPFEAAWSGVVDNFIGVYSRSYAIVNSSTACVSRNTFLRIGGFPRGVSSGEDIIMWLKFSFVGQVVCTTKLTSVYNRRDKSLLQRERYDRIPGSLLYISGLLSSPETPNSIKKALQSLYLKIALRTCAWSMLSGSLRMWQALVTDSRCSHNYRLLAYLILIRLLFVPFSLKKILCSFIR